MIKYYFYFLLYLTYISASHASSVLINFNGNLIDRKCEIAEQDVVIQFIPYSLGYIERDGNLSDKKNLEITFKNCTPTLANKAFEISLSTNDIFSKNGVKYLATQGVTGIVIGLEDMDGNLVSFNQKMEISVFADNTAKLSLNSYLMKGDFVKPGSFYGIASILVSYN